MNSTRAKHARASPTPRQGKTGTAEPLPRSRRRPSENFTGSAARGDRRACSASHRDAGAARASGPETLHERRTPRRRTRSTEVETEVNKAPGTINRLSVSVLLDSSVVKPPTSRAGPSRSTPRRVSTPTRGDAVKVTTVAFTPPAQKAAKQQLSAAAGSSARTRCSISSAHPDAADHRRGAVLRLAAIKRAESNRVPLRVPLDLRELEAADTARSSPRAAPRRGSPSCDRRVDRRPRSTRHRGRDHRPHRAPARRGRADPALLARRPEDIARGAEVQRRTQKAAILLMQAGKERAATVLRALREQEVAEIMAEVARLHHLEVTRSKRCSTSSREIHTRAPTWPRAATQTARELLEASFGGSKADEILDNLGVTMVAAPFEFLRRADTRQVLTYLQDEHPQTIALVLAHMHPDAGAMVLELAARRAAARRRAPHREDGPHLARGHRAGRGDPRAQALDGHPAVRLRAGGRAADARRHPQLVRPRDRAPDPRRPRARKTASSPTRCATACSCSRTSRASTTASIQLVLRVGRRQGARGRAQGCRPEGAQQGHRRTCRNARPRTSPRRSSCSGRSSSRRSKRRRPASCASSARSRKSGQIDMARGGDELVV